MSDEPAPSGLTTLQRASGGRLHAPSFFSARTWRDEFRAHGLPGIVMSALLIAAFVGEMFNGGPWAWGLSGQALAEGRWYAVGTHMFAHAGLTHLVMNLSALTGLSPVVAARLGPGAGGGVRYFGLFLLAGLAGAATYLAIHPFGAVPMVGASGAICGLWGAAARIGPDGGMVPLRSGQVWTQVKAFVRSNAILFAIIFALVYLSGGVGGLAWEAHLGGFVFGLLAMPWLAPRPPAVA